MKVVTLEYKLECEGEELQQLPALKRNALQELMKRNGWYHWRVIVFSCWGILLFLAFLAYIRCLFEHFGLCGNDSSILWVGVSVFCFDETILWMSPGYFVDDWLNSSQLLVDSIITCVIIYGIKNYNFCLTVVGAIWLVINGFVMVFLGKRAQISYYNYTEGPMQDDWRYFILALLCLFAFLCQTLYTYKVSFVNMMYYDMMYDLFA